MTWFWFCVFLILIFIEICTVNLTTVWFAIGSLIAFLVAFVTDSIVIQACAFIISSIAILFCMRPIVKKMVVKKVIPTNSDRLIGVVCDVTKKIEHNKNGEVKVFGTVWSAYSDQEIEVGTKVRVKKIEGVKLIVEKEEND